MYGSPFGTAKVASSFTVDMIETYRPSTRLSTNAPTHAVCHVHAPPKITNIGNKFEYPDLPKIKEISKIVFEEGHGWSRLVTVGHGWPLTDFNWGVFFWSRLVTVGHGPGVHGDSIYTPTVFS